MSNQGTNERIRLGPKKKIAFVCSGGATKAGAFHLGVALALYERGFRFLGGTSSTQRRPNSPGPLEISTYVGSSAGSIVSSYLASGYSLQNVFNAFLGREGTSEEDLFPKRLSPLTYKKMFKFRPEILREQLESLYDVKGLIGSFLRLDWETLTELPWLRSTGLFSTKGIEKYMREEVLPANRFQDFFADLFIVATQLNHSRKIVFGKYRYAPPPHDLNCQYDNDVSVSEACASSTALPLVFAPYSVERRDGERDFYIDGEIRDTLSTHVAVDSGADLIFASYTHQPYHFQREIGSLTKHGLPSVLIQAVYLLIEQKVNNYVHGKELQKKAILSLEKFCKEKGLSSELSRELCALLEEQFQFKRNIDTIYVHPSPNDSEMFFREHFSLTAEAMTATVRAGFRAMKIELSKYDFDSTVAAT